MHIETLQHPSKMNEENSKNQLELDKKLSWWSYSPKYFIIWWCFKKLSFNKDMCSRKKISHFQESIFITYLVLDTQHRTQKTNRTKVQ